MKRTIASLLTMAMILSIVVLGSSVSALAQGTSEFPESDFATAFARELWANTPSKSYATKVTFRVGDSNVSGVELTAGNTLDLATVSVGKLTGGTVHLGTDGVITVSNLTYSESVNNHQMLIYGAAKVVLINSVWRGNLRGDFADAKAYGDKNSLYPLLVTSHDGSRVVSNFDNAFRACDSIVIYGQIGVETTQDAFYISESIPYTSNSAHRGIAVLGALEDSSVAIRTTTSVGNKYFLGVSGSAVSPFVILAGDKTSDGVLSVDLNGKPLTLGGKSGSRLKIVDANVNFVGGDVAVSDSVSVSGDSVVSIAGTLQGESLTVSDTASVTANGLSFHGNNITVTDSASLTMPVSDGGFTAPVDGEYQVDGTARTLSAGQSVLCATASLHKTTSSWATSYAETLWASVPLSDKAQEVKVWCSQNRTAGPDFYFTVTDGSTVDLANLNTSIGNVFTSGTISLQDGVITLDGVRFDPGATIVPDLVPYGAAKIVIKNGVWKGNIRGDFTNTSGKTLLPLLITSDGTGALEATGVKNTRVNALRNYDSILIYGKISAKLYGDCFYLENTAFAQGPNHNVILFAPELDSVLDCSTANFGGLVEYGKVQGTPGKILFGGIAGGSGKISVYMGGRKFLQARDTTNGSVVGDYAVPGIEIRDANVEFVDGALGSGAISTTVTISGTSRVVADGVEATALTVTDTASLTVKDSTAVSSYRLDTVGELSLALPVANRTVTAPLSWDYEIDGTVRTLNGGETVSCGKATLVSVKTSQAESLAEKTWEETANNFKTTQAVLRNASNYSTFVTVNSSVSSVDFSVNPAGPLVGGTMTFANGIVTLDGLVYSSTNSTTVELVVYGAAKIVVKNGTFRGHVRADYSKNSTSNILLITSDGTGAMDLFGVNALRAYDTMFIYGKISVDVTGDIFFENAAYANGQYHNGLIFAPEQDSCLDTNGAVYYSLIKYGDDTATPWKISFGGIEGGSAEITVNLNGYKLVQARDQGNGNAIGDFAIPKIEVCHANLTVNGSFGSGAGQVAMEIGGTSRVTVQNLQAGALSLLDAAALTVTQSATAGSYDLHTDGEYRIALPVSDGAVTVPVTGDYEVNGILQSLTAGTSVSCTSAVLVKSNLSWATTYAESVWSSVSASDKAATVKLWNSANRGSLVTLNNGDTVDFAVNPWGPFVGGTVSLRDGVITLDGLTYAANNTVIPDLVPYGAAKVVIKNGTYRGNFRGDFSAIASYGSHPLLITSDGTGSFDATGAGGSNVNALRNYDSILVYGKISANVSGDCFYFDSAGFTEGTHYEILFAPERDSVLSVTDASQFNALAGYKTALAGKTGKIMFGGVAGGSGTITVHLNGDGFTNLSVPEIVIRDANLTVVNGTLSGGPVTVSGTSKVVTKGLETSLLSLSDSASLTVTDPVSVSAYDLNTDGNYSIALPVFDGTAIAPVNGNYNVDGIVDYYPAQSRPEGASVSLIRNSEYGFDSSAEHKIIVTDVRNGSLVVLDLNQWNGDWDSLTGSQAVVWEWTGGNSGLDGVKFRYSPYYGKDVVLATTSGGTAYVIDYATKNVLWRVSGIYNAHSIELLPNGDIVIAASGNSDISYSDGGLHYYPAGSTTRAAFLSLPFAHAVVWDDNSSCLWSIGFEGVVAIQTSKQNGSVSMTKMAGKGVVWDSLFTGHDMAPVFGAQGKFWVSDDSHVYLFDAQKNTLTAMDDLYSYSHVKGIASFEDGTVVFAKAGSGNPTTSSYTTALIVHTAEEECGAYGVARDYVFFTNREFYKVHTFTKNYS